MQSWAAFLGGRSSGWQADVDTEDLRG